MSCRCYIHLVSIRYKDGALVRPVVIQEVRFPHVMQVLHLSGLYTLQEMKHWCDQKWHRRSGLLMSCRCYIHLVSIRNKDEALVGPEVIQQMRFPHVMQVLHLSDLYTLQVWSIGGASSDTGGEVSSCHAGAISIWSLYATRMKHWWGQWWYRRWGLLMPCRCYIYLVSICYKDEALVELVVIQEVRFPHIMRVATSIWSLYVTRMKHWCGQ